MNQLDFALDLKAIEDDGVIEGLAAGYGNVDFGGDVMLPGSAVVRGKSIPMLLYHDQRQPVGVWREFKETSEGLVVKGRFAMSTNAGRDAHAMTKDGALGGLSIGYKSLKDRVVGKVRHIAEALVHEVSLVTIPMNDRALIASVKEIDDIITKLRAGDRLQEREWERLLRKQFDLSNAEAERAVRINLKGQGAPGGTANTVDFAEKLRAALIG